MALWLALALALSPSARLKSEVEEKARAETADLLRVLCPEQCVLLSVEAKVEDEVVGKADPGFDPPGDAVAPVVRSISASVVADGKLPSAFRTRLKDLVGQRLRTAGAPAQVFVQAVDFPVRNPPHLEAPPQLPQPAPPPVSASSPIADAKPITARERLLDQAPALAALALLSLVALALGALFFLATRRPQEPAVEVEAPLPAPEAAAAPPAPVSMPEPRRRKLEKSLHDERAVRNAVVRDALVRGEAPLVARWVRELGDFLLEDLRGDAAAAPALAQVASEVVRAGPDPAALSELEGRVIAARLSRAAESADAAFAFLEGVRPDAFAAACRDLSPGALDAVLRFAPARLRTAALEDMAPEQRRELAFSWARRPEVPASYAIAAADELRERLGRVAGGPQHAERALSDLLDSLPRDEQDALLERLRREDGGKLGAMLLTESALLGAPAEVLAAAVLALPPARIVSYLAGADEALRDRVLLSCPARLRAELEEELRVRGSQPEAHFHAARRELLSRLREETVRRGIAPGEVRGWSRRGPERARLVSTAE